MKYWKSAAIAALLLAVSFLARATLASQPAQADLSKIEPGLYAAIAEQGSGDYIVYLHGSADLSAAYEMVDWNARGQYVVDTLQTYATDSQAEILNYLAQKQVDGEVTSYQPYWIANLVLVSSSLPVLEAVSARMDVTHIEADTPLHLPQPAGDIEAIEWGVAKINAPGVWSSFGTTGEGIVVANIDTGVDIDHPALINQYRGWNGSSFDHDKNFYDPAGICGPSPCDNNNHGTHTMGTMVGDDGGSNQIGVAPGAQWIAAKGCESSSCSSSSLLSSAQWVLAPCDWEFDPGHASCDPSARPNIVNNSWGGGGGNTWYQASVDAWQASGIIPVFSAGNSGPFAGSIGSPGDYCNVLGVGATTSSDAIASFSSRGPGNFNACRDKPDVSAPGASVRSSVNGGGYGVLSGTSMAAPHVAGCTALLLSIDSTLTYPQIYSALTTSAVDLGTGGFDNNFGYGRINCLAAANALGPQLPFDLTATPTGPTTVPSCGGLVPYTILIENNQMVNLTWDVWTMVMRPNGEETGPVNGPVQRAIPASGAETINAGIQVPGRAPAGNYAWFVRSGLFSSQNAESSFSFTKTTAACQAGAQTYDDWAVIDMATGELLQATDTTPTSVSLSAINTAASQSILVMLFIGVLAICTGLVLVRRRAA